MYAATCVISAKALLQGRLCRRCFALSLLRAQACGNPTPEKQRLCLTQTRILTGRCGRCFLYLSATISHLPQKGIMYLQKLQSVRDTSKQQYTAAGRDFQVLEWYSRWGKMQQGDCSAYQQSKRSSASTLSLCGHKTRAFKHPKAFSF